MIQPVIYVYPAQAYGELLPVAFENIHRLNNILYGPSAPMSEELLPVAPIIVHRPQCPIITGSGIKFR